MNQEIAAAPTAQLDGRSRDFTQLLSATPRGARLARLLATEQLRSWGLPTHPAEHIVAELAANAVTHGRVPGRDFRLTLYVIGDTLRIEVTDTRGDRMPRAQQPAPDGESGRGLLLVDAARRPLGIRPGPHPAQDRLGRSRVPPHRIAARHAPVLHRPARRVIKAFP